MWLKKNWRTVQIYNILLRKSISLCISVSLIQFFNNMQCTHSDWLLTSFFECIFHVESSESLPLSSLHITASMADEIENVTHFTSHTFYVCISSSSLFFHSHHATAEKFFFMCFWSVKRYPEKRCEFNSCESEWVGFVITSSYS